MTTYESDIKTISSSEEVVFNQLSDLNNLKRLQELDLGANSEYADKLKDMEFDADSVFFSVDGFGKVGMRIIEHDGLIALFDLQCFPLRIQFMPVP